MPNKEENVEICVWSVQDMSAVRLYEILKLRQDVFLVEEDLRYPDLDDYDESALHIVALVPVGGQMVIASYARIFYDETEHHVKIGRVATLARFRGRGLANLVLVKAFSVAELSFGAKDVWIDAQSKVESFYKRLNFETVSAPFCEAGISHVRMRRIL